jgi:hypothetical protein
MSADGQVARRHVADGHVEDAHDHRVPRELPDAVDIYDTTLPSRSVVS